MEDLYSIHPGVPTISQDITDLMKARIAGHPRYPSLLSAYIDCRKVGAPPELASFLEDIAKESYRPSAANCHRTVSDPELDEFMESYCQVLRSYQEELSRPFDEAKSFLNNIESQLNDLCKITTSTVTTAACNSRSDAVGGSSEEEIEASKSQEGCSRLSDQELKEMLLNKYSGYLSSLRKEFLKKKKKGKLPKDSTLMLLDWWNAHYRWPYPTEEEKAKLGEMTGLDQKQINNWFINQRKRHWKPSEDMRFALMDGVGGGVNGTTTLYFDRGPLGP